jgi:molybdopterin/thiamine biosynthesis adenylyltransferase/rhodanese-related sulfurtransferase
LQNSDTKKEIFSPLELKHYARHLVLPGFGIEAQQKLKGSSVLIVGLGGLGSPAALYLAAAGIGRLGLYDPDQVAVSNLQRQILYGYKDLGKSKADVAQQRLQDLNPHIQIEAKPIALTPMNAMEIIKDFDCVIDGTDQLAMRYLLNDACVLLDKPYLYAAIQHFEGQLAAFHWEGGPCYRCLFPNMPPPELIPTCSEGGVLGVLPGILGSLQACEAIKILTNLAPGPKRHLLKFKALTLEFQQIEMLKRSDCEICGEQATIRGIDAKRYPSLICAVDSFALKRELSLNFAQWQSKKRSQPIRLIDVREPVEFAAHNIGGELIPLGKLLQMTPDASNGLDQPILFVCQTGLRSEQAAFFLRESGNSQAYSLAGGLSARTED